MLKKIREVMVLFFVGITSAFILSFVYKKTSPVISKHMEETLQKSLNEVYADRTVNFEEIKPDTLWQILKEGKCVGLIYRFEEKGYSGKIKPIVAVDSIGRIIRVKIPKEELTETPGLGMKVSEEPFLNQFRGLALDEIWLKKDKREGKIDAITSATISSRAATAAIREGLKQFEKFLPGYEVKEFMKNSLESFEKSSDSALEEIMPDKLWKISDSYIYSSEVEDSSSVFHIIVSIKEQTVWQTLILVAPKEKTESPESSAAIGRELERTFKGVSLKNIDKLEFLPEIKDVAEKISKEIKIGYEKFIEGREK
jgi:RnfABCDGE-type electron transport complex G subunit